MVEMLSSPEFWIGLGVIIWVNVILSGDNAVVIALAARSLPAPQQRLAILWGAGAAVVLRVLLTIVAVKLLEFPFLKIVGGFALLWIAVKLIVPEDEGEGEVQPSAHLVGAIKTILIADLVMSTDNVLAVAAAAKGSMVLLTLGLLISIPLVVFGATVLGWTAGDMGITDPALADWVKDNAHWLEWGAPITSAVFVVAFGEWLARRGAPGGEKNPREIE